MIKQVNFNKTCFGQNEFDTFDFYWPINMNLNLAKIIKNISSSFLLIDEQMKLCKKFKPRKYWNCIYYLVCGRKSEVHLKNNRS
jgi:hypothetical protein